MIKKKTPHGYESYHKISSGKDTPKPPRQPPGYSVRTPTKENFNKTSEEVESGTQTDFVFNNMYVKNDVFDAFYEDYIQYKGYANQPIFIGENEVTEPHIDDEINNDVNQNSIVHNSNINNNVTVRRKIPTPVINQFPEREIYLIQILLNKVKALSQEIPSTMKLFVLVVKHMC